MTESDTYILYFKDLTCFEYLNTANFVRDTKFVLNFFFFFSFFFPSSVSKHTIFGLAWTGCCLFGLSVAKGQRWTSVLDIWVHDLRRLPRWEFWFDSWTAPCLSTKDLRSHPNQSHLSSFTGNLVKSCGSTILSDLISK